MQDKIFKILLILAALVVPLVGGGIIYSLTLDASGAFQHFGFWHFISSDQWVTTAGREQYGALPFITGTMLTTALALIICIPFSLPVALFTGEYFRGKKIATALATVTDLLAGIPSIIYGLWGFYAMRPLFMWLDLSPQGSGILTAAFVLAIMIVPYAASLSSEFIKMVPSDLKEAAYGLGATRAEVIRRVIFPTAGSGIFSAYSYRPCLGRNHDGDDAHRKYQPDARDSAHHGKHDGQYHCQSVWRGRRSQIVVAHCHRFDFVSHHRPHQFGGQDNDSQSATCVTKPKSHRKK